MNRTRTTRKCIAYTKEKFRVQPDIASPPITSERNCIHQALLRASNSVMWNDAARDLSCFITLKEETRLDLVAWHQNGFSRMKTHHWSWFLWWCWLLPHQCDQEACTHFGRHWGSPNGCFVPLAYPVMLYSVSVTTGSLEMHSNSVSWMGSNVNPGSGVCMLMGY
jgi:hypothetical protein